MLQDKERIETALYDVGESRSEERQIMMIPLRTLREKNFFLHRVSYTQRAQRYFTGICFRAAKSPLRPLRIIPSAALSVKMYLSFRYAKQGFTQRAQNYFTGIYFRAAKSPLRPLRIIPSAALSVKMYLSFRCAKQGFTQRNAEKNTTQSTQRRLYAESAALFYSDMFSHCQIPSARSA
jgi:hypothetical protein